MTTPTMTLTTCTGPRPRLRLLPIASSSSAGLAEYGDGTLLDLTVSIVFLLCTTPYCTYVARFQPEYHVRGKGNPFDCREDVERS